MLSVEQYLLDLQTKLLHVDNWQRIVLTRKWASQIPSVAGVYILKQNDEIVYVGETGNLRGRMTDLLDSRNHTVRRTLGVKLFSSHEGFKQANAKTKFPQHIENLLDTHIGETMYLAYLNVPLGRKELEEVLEATIGLEVRLNKRGKRQANAIEKVLKA